MQSKTGVVRGTIYIAIALGVFNISGYIIRFFLGRYLGPSEYGAFGVVISLMTVINMFLTSGLPRSASKYISEDETRISSIIRDTTRIQLVFCILAFIIYFGSAGFIADYILKDPSLTPYLRLSALGIPAYAFCTLYGAGYLNGMRYFGRQSLETIGSSLVKIVTVFALVLFGFGIRGAIIGYTLTPLFGLVLAWKLLGSIEKSNTSFGWQKLVRFAIPMALFATVNFSLMQIGLYSIKRVLSEEQVGYYTSAIDIGTMSTLIVGALATVLFPSISNSIARNDIIQTKNYIQQSLRYIIMIILPLVMIISATSNDLLTLTYSSEYVDAAEGLKLLVFGAGAMGIYSIMATIIMGSGKPGIALSIAVLMLFIEILFNVLLVPPYELAGAAWAHIITASTGMLLTTGYVFLKFKVLPNPVSLGRIVIGSLIIYFICLQVSVTSLLLLLIYAGLAILYLALLTIMKEINRNDWEIIKRILPVNRSPEEERSIL